MARRTHKKSNVIIIKARRVNRRYKDRVFTKLFNDPKRALSLYNALTGSNYSPDTPIIVNTIQNTLTVGKFNDLSFVIDGKLVIIVEHQSTYDRNMPLRMMLYLSSIYERILEDNKALYGGKLELLRPEFIMLYNGDEDIEDLSELKLSDLFKQVAGHERIDIEIIVRVYNINDGRNAEILEKCESLKKYAKFIGRVKENLIRSKAKGEPSLQAAIREAVAYCIANNILKDFLEQHGKEVVSMLTAEFKLKTAQQVWKEMGVEEGRVITAQNLIKDGFDVSKVAKYTELDMAIVEKLYNELH
jgi:predicted transposase/invertase (TIGR01784 family)